MSGINGLPPKDAVQPVPRIEPPADRPAAPDFDQQPAELNPPPAPLPESHAERITPKEPGTYERSGRKTPPPPGTRLDVRSR